VDFLRTTYKSKFYYSRDPDQSIVGTYLYASESAQFLEQPSFYGAAIWLDPWEAGRGLGDSLEDYERVEGEPVSDDVFDAKKEVYPLRSGCPEPRSTSLTMSGPVYMDLPTKCWRRSSPLPPADRYRVTFTNVVDTSRPDLPTRSFTLDVDKDLILIWYWYGTSVEYDSTLAGDGMDTPLPENSKVYYRWYYFDIVYISNFYVSIPPFWWSGLTINNPTVVPVGSTTSITCERLRIERL